MTETRRRGRYHKDRVTDPITIVVRPVESDRGRDGPSSGENESMEIRICGATLEREKILLAID